MECILLQAFCTTGNITGELANDHSTVQTLQNIYKPWHGNGKHKNGYGELKGFELRC